MKVLGSERFVVCVRSQSAYQKIFQVFFSSSDGTLFVNFPYFLDAPGLVSVVTFNGGLPAPTELQLIPGGKVTSHKVKFSYHPDGRVHFSQSGKVRTEIQKRALRLHGATDHIFTSQVQGLAGFTSVSVEEQRKKPSVKKILLTFDVDKTADDYGVKFVGRWYSQSDLQRRVRGNVEGPKVVGETPDHRQIQGFVLTAPEGNPSNGYVLLLTCEIVPLLNKDGQPLLSFIGGFDPPSVMNDLSQDTRFLALLYPASDYDELQQQIGTIDL